MVVTVLQAQVASDQWKTLEQAYGEGVAQLDRGITQTFLLHGFADPSIWQIVTVWQSREALDEMRRSGETPRGVLFFRAAGAEPVLSVFGVAAHAPNS
jgi:hypothetical protein